MMFDIYRAFKIVMQAFPDYQVEVKLYAYEQLEPAKIRFTVWHNDYQHCTELDMDALSKSYVPCEQYCADIIRNVKRLMKEQNDG